MLVPDNPCPHCAHRHQFGPLCRGVRELAIGPDITCHCGRLYSPLQCPICGCQKQPHEPECQPCAQSIAEGLAEARTLC